MLIIRVFLATPVPTPVHYCINCILVFALNTDVNECSTGNGGCGQMCTNTDGSFQCSCILGFELASDGFSCNGKCTSE